MDIPDFDLMVKIPHLMNGTYFDEMISEMLDSENVKSNQPPKQTSKNGIIGIPSTINTDWTQKATEIPFLKALSNSGATTAQMKEYEAGGTSKSKGSKHQEMWRHSKEKTMSVPYVLPQKNRDLQKQSDPIGNCKSWSEFKASLETDEHFSKNKECQEFKPMLSDEKVKYEHSQYPGKVGIMTEHKRKEKLQTTDSTSRAVLNSSTPDAGLTKEAKTVKPLLFKLQETETQNPELDGIKMEQIIDTLVKAQTKDCSEMPKAGTKEWTELRVQQAIVRENANSVPATTLQDHNRLIVGGKFLKTLERIVRECVNFAKKIPGFKDLHLDDQVALIKGNRQQTHLPGTFRSVNRESCVITPLPGHHFTFDDFVAFYSERIAINVFETSYESIWQTTRPEEDAVLKAIMLTDPGPCEYLRNREKIDALHHDMVSCLKYVIAKTATDVNKRKEELDYIVLACNEFSTKNRIFFKEKLMQEPHFTKNEVLTEVL